MPFQPKVSSPSQIRSYVTGLCLGRFCIPNLFQHPRIRKIALHYLNHVLEMFGIQGWPCSSMLGFLSHCWAYVKWWWWTWQIPDLNLGLGLSHDFQTERAKISLTLLSVPAEVGIPFLNASQELSAFECFAGIKTVANGFLSLGWTGEVHELQSIVYELQDSRVKFFWGLNHPWKVLRKYGYDAASFEISDDPIYQDILHPLGFAFMLATVFRLIPKVSWLTFQDTQIY